MQVVRRVGLIGDVHAEDDALEVVLGELRRLGADVLIQVGDIADGPGDLDRTVALLLENEVHAVRGNHDRWLLTNQCRSLPHAHDASQLSPAVADYLAKLPVMLELRSPRGHVLVCHGLGSNDMVGVKPYDEGVAISSNSELQALINQRRYRFVLNGHTHQAMLRTFGPLSIINAGTLLRDYERSFTYVDFERGELQRYRHPAHEPLPRELGGWRFERQILAESPSEPFRDPFI